MQKLFIQFNQTKCQEVRRVIVKLFKAQRKVFMFSGIQDGQDPDEQCCIQRIPLDKIENIDKIVQLIVGVVSPFEVQNGRLRKYFDKMQRLSPDGWQKLKLIQMPTQQSFYSLKDVKAQSSQYNAQFDQSERNVIENWLLSLRLLVELGELALDNLDVRYILWEYEQVSETQKGHIQDQNYPFTIIETQQFLAQLLAISKSKKTFTTDEDHSMATANDAMNIDQ
ncbi:hypothetical protein MP228_003760 [Amoeboaphelidium protococcarum]|nr:hypothetical protein MP228_003760 [Amoeboaphelidium protococcarum]